MWHSLKIEALPLVRSCGKARYFTEPGWQRLDLIAKLITPSREKILIEQSRPAARSLAQRVGQKWGLDRLWACFQLPAMETKNEFAPRGGKAEIEEGEDFSPKFDADGLIPAMALDATTQQPLMLAYMNAESLRRTLEIGEAVYWSRSRKEFWHKGATSGHIQKIVEIRTDCDQDALVLLVEQLGAGACHTGRNSCFYRKVVPGTTKLESTGGEKSFDPAAVYAKH